MAAERGRALSQTLREEDGESSVRSFKHPEPMRRSWTDHCSKMTTSWLVDTVQNFWRAQCGRTVDLLKRNVLMSVSSAQ